MRFYFLGVCKCGCNEITYGNKQFRHRHAWNKGKKGNPQSIEAKKKNSAAHIGRKLSEYTKAKLSLIRRGKPSKLKGRTRPKEVIDKIIRNRKWKRIYFPYLCACGCGEIVFGVRKCTVGHQWNKGKPLSTEAKNKLSLLKKGRGHPHTKETKQWLSLLNIGKVSPNKGKKFGAQSEETKRKKSIKMKGNANCGENNGNWKGGTSFFPYCSKFTNELREQVRLKYHRKCLICGKQETENKRRLSVHHIYYDKNEGCNGKSFELVPLCNSCHSKTITGNKQEWIKYILMLVHKADLFFDISDVHPVGKPVLMNPL